MDQMQDDPGANRRIAPRYWANGQCIIRTSDGPVAGRLRDISAAGAFIETLHGIAVDTAVSLEHPAAGRVDARVARQTDDGISLSFALSDSTVTFALKVIAAEISAQRGSHTPVAAVSLAEV